MKNKNILAIIIIAFLIAVVATPVFIWNWTSDCLFRGDLHRECVASAWSSAVNGVTKGVFGGE